MIQNLTLKNSYILGANCVGGIVGYGDNVQDCHNIKTPVICREGNYHTAGGIAGQINKTIKNCSNSGDVTVKGSFQYSNCGGIMGGSQSGEGVEIDNCVNYGEVTGKEASIGGVVGTWRGLSTFSNCINKGNVKGKGNVGGVIGQANSKSTINNCANSGKVIGDASHTGGIIGLMSRNNTTLENSIKLEKCYNTGEIVGKDYTGGIVGRVAGQEGKGSVTYCYTKGKIKGTTNVGAVIGEQDNSTGLNIMNNLYYLFSVGIGAINGVDKEEDKIISTTEDIRSYEAFKVWIEQQ